MDHTCFELLLSETNRCNGILRIAFECSGVESRSFAGRVVELSKEGSVDLPCTEKRNRFRELYCSLSQFQSDAFLSSLNKNVEERIRRGCVPVVELEGAFAVFRAFNEVFCSVNVVIIGILGTVDSFETE